MGLLVRLDEWVSKKRVDCDFFDREFKGMENKMFATDRTVSDVLQIFEDITGVRLERADEDFIIRHWVSQGWSNHDFRMVIEYHFNSERERQFLDQPGRMNLRMMLNTSRAQRINDVLRDLRFQHGQRTKKSLQKELGQSSPPMLMRCGKRITRGDKASYDHHMNECFQAKGACFF